MTRTWADRLLPNDAQVLARYFPDPPDLTGVVLRSMRFERRGPGCVLRLDLPGPVQGSLGFLAIDDVRLTGGRLPGLVTISMREQPVRRLAVEMTGEDVRLSLTCADQIRFGRVSTHDTPPDELDLGPHAFHSKLDQRLHSSVPGAEVDTYHANF
jgi:hypothetical protein